MNEYELKVWSVSVGKKIACKTYLFKSVLI